MTSVIRLFSFADWSRAISSSRDAPASTCADSLSRSVRHVSPLVTDSRTITASWSIVSVGTERISRTPASTHVATSPSITPEIAGTALTICAVVTRVRTRWPLASVRGSGSPAMRARIRGGIPRRPR